MDICVSVGSSCLGSCGAAFGWLVNRYVWACVSGYTSLVIRCCSCLSLPKAFHLTAEARSACSLAASVPSSRVPSWNQPCCSASLAVIRLFGSNANILCNKSKKFDRKGFVGGMISCPVLAAGIDGVCPCQSQRTSSFFILFTNRLDALVVSVIGYSSLRRLK